MTITPFQQRRQQVLEELARQQGDKSRKGSVDEPIAALVESINRQGWVYTTSSCSGRISVFGEPTLEGRAAGKKGGEWVYATHGLADGQRLLHDVKRAAMEGCSSLVLRYEPFILAAEAQDLAAAQTIVQLARDCGFRESGLTAGQRIITSVRCSLRLEVPLSGPASSMGGTDGVDNTSADGSAGDGDGNDAHGIGNGGSSAGGRVTGSSSGGGGGLDGASAAPSELLDGVSAAPAELLVPDSYVLHLVDLANSKQRANWDRINRFQRAFESLVDASSGGGAAVAVNRHKPRAAAPFPCTTQDAGAPGSRGIGGGMEAGSAGEAQAVEVLAPGAHKASGRHGGGSGLPKAEYLARKKRLAREKKLPQLQGGGGTGKQQQEQQWQQQQQQHGSLKPEPQLPESVAGMPATVAAGDDIYATTSSHASSVGVMGCGSAPLQWEPLLGPAGAAAEADAAEDAVASAADGLLRRWGHSVCVWGRQLVVFGGYGGGGAHSRCGDLLLVDPWTAAGGGEGGVGACKTLHPTTAGPGERTGHSAVVVGDNLIVIGGRRGPAHPLGDVWSCDLNTGEWTYRCAGGSRSTGDSSGSGGGVASVAEGGDLGQAGGQEGEEGATAGRATPGLLLLPPRYRHSAVVVESGTGPPRVYVFGGCVDGSALGDLWVLDTSDWRWTRCEATGHCPGPRYSHAATAHGRHMLLHGGRSGYDEVYHDVYRLCTESLRWERLQVAAAAGGDDAGGVTSCSQQQQQRDCPGGRFSHSLTVISSSSSGGGGGGGGGAGGGQQHPQQGGCNGSGGGAGGSAGAGGARHWLALLGGCVADGRHSPQDLFLAPLPGDGGGSCGGLRCHVGNGDDRGDVSAGDPLQWVRVPIAPPSPPLHRHQQQQQYAAAVANGGGRGGSGAGGSQVVSRHTQHDVIPVRHGAVEVHGRLCVVGGGAFCFSFGTVFGSSASVEVWHLLQAAAQQQQDGGGTTPVLPAAPAAAAPHAARSAPATKAAAAAAAAAVVRGASGKQSQQQLEQPAVPAPRQPHTMGNSSSSSSNGTAAATGRKDSEPKGAASSSSSGGGDGGGGGRAGGAGQWAAVVARTQAKGVKDMLKARGWLDTRRKSVQLPAQLQLPGNGGGITASDADGGDSASSGGADSASGADEPRVALPLLPGCEEEAVREAARRGAQAVQGAAAAVAGQSQEGRYQVLQLLSLPGLVPGLRGRGGSPAESLRGALRVLLEEAGAPGVDGLLEESPTKWERLGRDLALLPEDCMTSPDWLRYITPPDRLWGVVARELGVSRLGRQARVAPTGTRDSRATPLYGGGDGWVEHREAGVCFGLDVTKCMFSSGNVSERIRMGRLCCQDEVIVDLYAGIGFYSLPLLVNAGAARVIACEWNPAAVEALQHNLRSNGVEDQAEVRQGDCREVAPKGVADRVCLGLLPSSKGGWATAVAALKPRGGWLHVHENVSDKDEAEFLRSTPARLEALAAAQGRRWSVVLRHRERVKWYAPHVRHLVLDLQAVEREEGEEEEVKEEGVVPGRDSEEEDGGGEDGGGGGGEDKGGDGQARERAAEEGSAAVARQRRPLGGKGADGQQQRQRPQQQQAGRTPGASASGSTGGNGIGDGSVDGSGSGWFQAAPLTPWRRCWEEEMQAGVVPVVDAAEVSMTAERFASEIIGRGFPAVLRGLDMGHCLGAWSAESLAAHPSAASTQVGVHVCTEPRGFMAFVPKRNFEFRTMSLRELVLRAAGIGRWDPLLARGERYYLRSLGANPRKEPSHLEAAFPSLAGDVKLPRHLLPGGGAGTEFSSVLRISSPGLQLWTHMDVMDNMLMQVTGTKRVMLWPPCEEGKLYVIGSSSEVTDVEEEQKCTLPCTAPGNQDAGSTDATATPAASSPAGDGKYPLFASARRLQLTLRPGDCLFIPALWFHNVRTLEPTHLGAAAAGAAPAEASSEPAIAVDTTAATAGAVPEAAFLEPATGAAAPAEPESTPATAPVLAAGETGGGMRRGSTGSGGSGGSGIPGGGGGGCGAAAGSAGGGGDTTGLGISVNLFWRGLPVEQYERKDLYGNRDPIPAGNAAKAVDEAAQQLDQLPSPYGRFYADRMVRQLQRQFNL